MESKIEIAGMQKVEGQKMRFPRGAKERLMQFFVEAPAGYYTLKIDKSRRSKSDSQVKMIFGLMIQSTIEQAEYLGIGVEELLVYLMDGNIPKGVGLNKDFLHALMYEVCPTFDDEGRRVTLSKMNTKQAADLFERYRNLLAPLGIVIQDPDPNWRNK